MSFIEKETQFSGTWEDAVQFLINDPERADLVKFNYFDLPLKEAALRYHQSEEWQAIKKFSGKASGLAVDIGAGNGIVSHALAVDGWSVIAVEPDPSDLVGAGAIRELSNVTGLRIEVKSGVGESIPVGDNEATLVIARQVLHHANNLESFLKEISRILKPGGLLISARDHVITGPNQLPVFLDSHELHHLYGGENAFEVKVYRDMIENAGLKIKREIGSFDSPINYAPQNLQTLRTSISEKMHFLKPVIHALLGLPYVLQMTLKLLSKFDRRPGRHVSFIAQKD